MKNRILQLIGSFHLGGSEKQAVALTRNLREDATFEIFVATLNNDGVLREKLADVSDILEYRLTSFYNANFVKKVRECAAYLRANKIDLVHSHDFYTNVFGMSAATLAGVKVRVASKRETAGMRSHGQEFVEGLAFKRATAVVANSDAVRDHLIDRSVPSGKIRTIYNGVDLTLFSSRHDREELCKALGLPTDKRFLTLVANLRHDVKNVPMFLRAAKNVIKDVTDAHFVIAGEGELEAELRQVADDHNLSESVTFLGRCDNVPALLDASFACVLTSNAEGFANSILEYMAAGKPVVATNVGGAAEAIIDGETGYLVETNDDAAMACRLIELLRNETKAAKFGVAAKKSVSERFSQEAQLRATIELYDSLFSYH